MAIFEHEELTGSIETCLGKHKSFDIRLL